MSDVSASDIEDVREVFDLFDFWDGRDGMVDGAKIGEFLRACNMNPTEEIVRKNGGTKKMGEKQYKFEEILPIYKAVVEETDTGTFADFMEGFKTFDREGQGYVSKAEVIHMLTCMGPGYPHINRPFAYTSERCTDNAIDQIFQMTDTTEDLDGNIKYEEFIKKVMAGGSK